MPVTSDASIQAQSDVYCTVCGYDLRGLHSGGQCPECAAPIRDSIHVHTDDRRIAKALKTIAASFFIACIPILGTAVSVALRIIAGRDLRFRCGLHFRPATARGVRWLWTISIAQAIVVGIAIACWMGQVRGFSSMYLSVNMTGLLLGGVYLLEAIYFVIVWRLSAAFMKQRDHQGLLGSLRALGVLAVLCWTFALLWVVITMNIAAPLRETVPCFFVPGILIWPLVGLTLNDVARQIYSEVV